MKLGTWVAAALVIGCGGSNGNPTPTPAPQAASPSAPATDDLNTDLPPARPSPFEVDLRQRTQDGDDHVLKLTENGARYGVARGKARVALRFPVDPADLDDLYATLRQVGYDRIETQPLGNAPSSGSSMRVKAGPQHVSVSSMGRMQPTEAWTDAYARSVAATEALLPRGRSETVVEVRWHESMEGRAAAIDVDVGKGFVGVHRLDGSRPDVEIHLAEARPLQMLLRYGSPPTSTPLAIEAGRDRGVEVAYDEQSDAVVLRPLPVGTAASAKAERPPSGPVAAAEGSGEGSSEPAPAP